MIDFHSHILPNVDDGPDSVEESLAMLRHSFLQGVDAMVSTSHFYGNQEYPRDFLRRRNEAFLRLQEAMLMSPDVYPRIVLGAEVLYFPGISDADEIASLAISSTGYILIEPPMSPWSDDMLDEIARIKEHFHCTPIIAHVDRFMVCLRNPTLIERIRERNMMVQVNTEYFLSPKTMKSAAKHLKNGQIQLMGSDCHNMSSRPPDMGLAWRQAKKLGVEREFDILHRNAVNLLLRRK